MTSSAPEAAAGWPRCAWPTTSKLTLDGALRQLDFLDGELVLLDGELARRVVNDSDVRRLMTIPGVDVTTAATLKAFADALDRRR